MKFTYFPFLFSLLIATSSFSGGVSAMERVRSLGINPNVPRTEVLSVLSAQSTDYLLGLRQSLFEDLAANGLVSEGDELVSRRCTKKKPLPVKLSEDICSHLSCVILMLHHVLPPYLQLIHSTTSHWQKVSLTRLL